MVNQSIIGSDPESVVRAFFDSWNEIGLRATYEQFLAEDVTLQNSGFRDWHPKADVLEQLDAYLAVFKRPFAEVTIHHLGVDGNTVLVEREEVNRNPETGDTFHGTMMAALVVDGGKITRWSEYHDPAPYKNGAALPRPAAGATAR